jgi:molybdopterin-guanine dinucleotide biosynthesis protein A|tara:strand:+ start:1037 stop:2140 length:1104 start_codon:yes stop_codon:yes gene_type:complete
MKHTKHTNLERRNNELFAPNEISILGSNCTIISDLVSKVSTKLSGYKLAYFDASHAKEVEENNVSEYVFHHQGNLQITTSGNVNKFQQRLEFAQFDYVFINGNHYQGSKQILILDEAKEASVLKRLDQLEHIQFVVKLKSKTEYFSFLEQQYPQIKNIPCYTIDEVDKITNHIRSLIQEKTPPVKGLVLIGGKSKRMGTDKSELNYYGKPQKEYVKELLEDNLLDTYFSVQNISENEKEIHDTFLNLGPFGGICSAFQKDPNSALLVVATDLPFVDKNLIIRLLENRNPSKVATAIKGRAKEFVEPLITIYEPKAYPMLLQYLAQGYSCPRKMLINSDVEIIEVDDNLIRNVNTPEEFENVKREINS